ncbi:Aspartic peptidase domain [Pseudocohnilembus persalinus]|uniref:Aspartic peptidase domain n=1 Tax=Pseudocohnilembus persalinus TaxID=266149 RepID=A0A0V0Q7X5_PSEPJ|nr:Aspartic peptidase domain [Pseudocohnilembus persalinus]|eukprot:KRW98255.1 Aspartic peptidase domain [Pseudocohnilembus persalinus]
MQLQNQLSYKDDYQNDQYSISDHVKVFVNKVDVEDKRNVLGKPPEFRERKERPYMFIDSGATYTYFHSSLYNSFITSFTQFCQKDINHCLGKIDQYDHCFFMDKEIELEKILKKNQNQKNETQQQDDEQDNLKSDEKIKIQQKIEKQMYQNFFASFPIINLEFHDNQDKISQVYKWEPKNYLFEQQQNLFCLGIEKYPGQYKKILLGQTFMRQNFIRFNKNQRKIEIIQNQNCSTDIFGQKTPLYDSKPINFSIDLGGPLPILIILFSFIYFGLKLGRYIKKKMMIKAKKNGEIFYHNNINEPSESQQLQKQQSQLEEEEQIDESEEIELAENPKQKFQDNQINLSQNKNLTMEKNVKFNNQVLQRLDYKNIIQDYYKNNLQRSRLTEMKINEYEEGRIQSQEKLFKVSQQQEYPQNQVFYQQIK